MKNKFPRVRYAWIAILGLIAMSNGVIGQEDRVFPIKGGAQVRGKIVERTKDKIVIEVRGTNQNFAINEVARVMFDGEPQQLSRTKDFLSQGNLDSAIEEFSKIDAGSLKSDEIKQDYHFYKGYIAAANALRGKGDINAAKELLLNWVRSNSNSHHFYEAATTLGELAMAAGSPGDAAKYFTALAASSFPDLKVKGGYFAGKASLAQKQIAEAKTKLTAVAQAQISDPASVKFKKLASVALIACDAADGKADAAIEALEKMVDEGDSSDAELFAELYNAMGSILQAQGKNEEAILAYLKTKLLYATETDAHAEALYWLTQLWPKVGDNQRATDAKTELAKTYPTSRWLKK
jgi:tetratricopeptide (TPR) repeat protein